MTRRKLTPKQRVLRKYPNACATRDVKGHWAVYNQEILGHAISAVIAWKLADMRISL